ncbi:hypothetical protein Daus18300_013999 [Diaporthe australafricana]|uniref:Uncharacterized protein n=1 Tax=Diaporthe australafricana TaxID=127596 RepID=A0ABR3VWZ5_9PEZI
MPLPVEYPRGTNDTMILKTIAGAVLNKSTSTRILDDYYVTPFWPSLSGSWATGAQQKWTAKAAAFSVQLDCSRMSVKSARNLTGPELFAEGICEDSKMCSNETMQYGNYADIELVSDDGCSVSIYRPLIAPGLASTSVNFLTLGGGWWTNDFNNLSWMAPTSTMFSYSNASSSCGSRSFLSFNTPWAVDQPLKTSSHVCSSSYLEAEVAATMIVSDISIKLSIDPQEFKSKQRQMDISALNTQELENTFFRANWESHFPTGYFAGPSQALASLYSNSSHRLVESGSILEDARKLQQQWLGQMLLSAQSVASVPTTENPASVTVIERRIVVVEGIGLVVGVLFLLAAAMLAVVTRHARLRRRPLCLSDDPASIAAATALVASDDSATAAFRGLSRASGQQIRKRLRLVWCNIEDGSLSAALPDPLLQDLSTPRSDQSSSTGCLVKDEQKTSAPSILRIWMGTLLLTTLVVLIALLTVLYRVSQTVKLHQRALVYEVHMSVASVATSLAPYSIVPTLLAVGIKLWYGAVEGTLKRLQPFSAMMGRSRPVKDSILVEYANSPLIFGFVKALRHSDWVLAFACLGALGTEVFTVGISALWDKETQTAVHTVEMSRQLELRQVPTVIGTKSFGSVTHTYSDPTLPTLLDTVYGNYLTSWLYGGLLETMEATTTPPWSMDMWSFAPVDFSFSSAAILGLSGGKGGNASLSSLPYNVSIETQALRARLSCSPVEAARNASTWLETLDFKTDSGWNSPNSPPGLDIGYELKEAVSVPNTSLPYYIIPQRGPVQCCANETGGMAGEAAIGYGTTMGYLGSRNTDLFVKWIIGRPLDRLYFDSNLTSADTRYAHWVWTEEPQMQGIACSRIIEEANATVTVDLSSGMVREYTIVGEPRNATAAWTDNDVARDPYNHVPANETQYGSEYNTTYSYGWMFWNGLVYSANLKTAAALASTTMQQADGDRVFNIRDTGINVDFLSLSALHLANQDRRALLDADTLIAMVSQAFGTYFKHFASEQVDPGGSGGRVFQPIGEQLPADLPMVASPQGTWYNESMAAVGVERTVLARVHMPVEVLVMSPTAVCTCLVVLVFLCPVTVAIYIFYRRRVEVLPRDVDTLASVLACVHDSPRLLEWARLKKKTGDWASDDVVMARLGEFQTSEGQAGWGVELIGRGR